MIHFVVPGDLSQLTGGYVYDRRIVEQLRALGREVRVHALDGAFPLTDETARHSAIACVRALDAGSTVVVDGLAMPAFAPLLDTLGQRVRLVALVHHPLCLETGLAASDRAVLADEESRSLRRVAGIVVTSRSTRTDLAALGISGELIKVVEPGCDPVPECTGRDRSQPRQGAGEVRLLCVATVTERKGHLILVEALAHLRDLSWHLDCVGSLEREPATVERLRTAIDRAGLGARISLHGEIDGGALAGLYAAADVFVLASWHEGYGMALAEAMGHGVPVVSTRAGAVPRTVPPEAGILVPVGDAPALTDALRSIIADDGLRGRLADGARCVRRPTWPEAGRRFLRELTLIELSNA